MTEQRETEQREDGQAGVERFLAALRRLEADGEVEPLVDLYVEDCVVGGSAAVDEHRGPGGARDFWQQYRRSFATMDTRFRSVVADDEHAALEWETDATVQDLHVRYHGVTMLELAAGRIARSHAYFDTRELARQLTPVSSPGPAGQDAAASGAEQGSPAGGYVP